MNIKTDNKHQELNICFPEYHMSDQYLMGLSIKKLKCLLR